MLNLRKRNVECPNFAERFSKKRVKETLGKLRHSKFVNHLFGIQHFLFKNIYSAASTAARNPQSHLRAT